MPIAAISSTLVTSVREPAHGAAQDTTSPRQSAGEPLESGRRHDLVGAMNQVFGGQRPRDAAGEQAVFRFAHALMRDLRSIDSAPERDSQAGDVEHGPGPGYAWGRRAWNDMSQRLDALATAASAPAPVVPTKMAEADVPPMPNPITTNSAALHLMQVPSSRLLEAYVALRKALGEQASSAGTASPRDELAAFLGRLSKAVATDASAALPAGSVLNLTA